MSKYIIAYCEKDKEHKVKFVYGGEATKEEYNKAKTNKFIYDKQLNETVFIDKIQLLEVIQEDEVSN